MLRSLLGIRRLVSFTAVYRLNKAYKKAWQGAHYYRKYPVSLPSA